MYICICVCIYIYICCLYVARKDLHKERSAAQGIERTRPQAPCSDIFPSAFFSVTMLRLVQKPARQRKQMQLAASMGRVWYPRPLGRQGATEQKADEGKNDKKPL